jgi:hypothetical protein
MFVGAFARLRAFDRLSWGELFLVKAENISPPAPAPRSAPISGSRPRP